MELGAFAAFEGNGTKSNNRTDSKRNAQYADIINRLDKKLAEERDLI